MIAKLALEDGTILTGEAVGASGTRTGEVVFNTAMTGYQEVFTDPSYCGQIVTMTFPLQGNYGVNLEDFESDQPHLSGVVLRELPKRPSNQRSIRGLPEFLADHGIIGVTGVDTRALTRRIRVQGALRGVISTEVREDVKLVELARASAPMTGADYVQTVTPRVVGSWDQPLWKHAANADPQSPTVNRQLRCHVVAIDCGIKHNILRHLTEVGCRVTVVPADATAEQIRRLDPAGVLVGNGPGDPAAVTGTIETLRRLLGQYQMLGVCLGHQLLAIALGAKTYKLGFGHHGANLPVINRQTARVEITSQNHGFAVDINSLERVGGLVTHVNLNDGSLEGFLHRDQRVMAVQFHPEASPGPHDASYLFQRFVEAIAAKRPLAMDTLAPAP
jgi:carbamoyl-phosphate synthase small subunit